MLTESEMKQPMCFSCAHSIGLVFDRILDESCKWIDICAFCDTKNMVFIPEQAVKN